ncbi:hypothetical protein Droror1_Dr00012752 [Drosera rotundifolia]
MKLGSFCSFKTKLMEPYTKLVSSITLKFDKRPPIIRTPPRFQRRRFRPTRTVRFRKPFLLRFPGCHPGTKLKFRRPSTRTKFRVPRRRRDKVVRPKGDRLGDRIGELLSAFKSMRRSTELEHRVDSMSDVGHAKDPFPSPITPAYMRNDQENEESSNGLDEVEDECRSFENYLVEMIVEEGKLRDLMDVEELLQCWKSLNSPVFMDLVSRFYGELCKDLFSGEYEIETEMSGSIN